MTNPINRKEFIFNVDGAIERLMNKRDLSVQNVADELNIQSQQLRRLIKSLTGMSSSDYIANYKISRAKEMLIQHDMLTIAKIGDLCGFEEPTHFTRFFKRRTGMTPGEYRKMGNKD